ncbi:MAG: 4a-hydroxytetrahydrobiopterin dehydratase [Verrucomicrobiia bacterium]
MAKLSASEIKASLGEVRNWEQQASAIARTWKFKDFAEAMRFVNAVANLAEAAQHHPDIDIRWNKVTLSLSTHSEGGLTSNDFELAKKIDRL